MLDELILTFCYSDKFWPRKLLINTCIRVLGFICYLNCSVGWQNCYEHSTIIERLGNVFISIAQCLKAVQTCVIDLRRCSNLDSDYEQGGQSCQTYEEQESSILFIKTFVSFASM